MPNAAVVAAALTTAGPHPFSLFVGPRDVMFLPDVYGVPVESIVVDEQGPGGVSWMEFDVLDYLGNTPMPDGAPILFQWNTPDVPLFRGFLDAWSATPAFGGQGRIISVKAIGIEALLDWRIIYGDVFTGVLVEEIQNLAGRADIRAGSAGVVSPQLSTLALPVSGYSRDVGDTAVATTPGPAETDGTVLRAAIQNKIDASIATDFAYHTFPPTATRVAVQFTIDFYGGLRVWNDYPTAKPSDYTNLTINDVYAGAIVASNLRYENDPSQIVHEVYVKGGAAVATGWFYDGTGIRGKQAFIDDSGLTTLRDAQLAAQVVIDAAANQVRGSFDIEDFTPAATIHPGSFVTITDAAVGLSAVSYKILEIKKTFNNSDRQNWTVSFGNPAPSAIRYIKTTTNPRSSL